MLAVDIHTGIVAALRIHGKTSIEIARSGLHAVVNLTYLNEEFLAANGRAFGEAGACPGVRCSPLYSTTFAVVWILTARDKLNVLRACWRGGGLPRY